MEHIPLGEVKPTPGTPLKLTVNFPTREEQTVHTIFFQVLPGNVGDVYIGRENMDVAAKTGIIARMRPPTANYLPDLVLQAFINISNPMRVRHYRIAVDNAGDGVLPTLGVA